MRDLRTQQDVDAPDSDFPSGRIRDDDGTGSFGTPVNESLYGDIHQNIMKIIRESGITPNNLPDSEYNGFQILEALETYLQQLHGTWASLSISANIAPAGAPYETPRYRVDTLRNVVEFRGVFVVVNPLSSPETIATVPGAATPGVTRVLQLNTINTGFAVPSNDFLTVSSGGLVVLPNPAGPSPGDFYSLDGLWYPL